MSNNKIAKQSIMDLQEYIGSGLYNASDPPIYFYSCPKCGDDLYMRESTGGSLGKFGVATCERCHCHLDWSEIKEEKDNND